MQSIPRLQTRWAFLVFLPEGSSAVAAKIQLSLCPGVQVMGKRGKKALIKERKEGDGGQELPSYDPISTALLFSSEVVLGVPYFKSALTDLRRRRCFTRRMLTCQWREPLTSRAPRNRAIAPWKAALSSARPFFKSKFCHL